MDFLTLKRNIFTDKSTLGELYVDGMFQCFTLEDTCRRVKEKGKTAIPSGRYQVIINDSARFKRKLPRLLNVPNYEGILIHPGNTADDTDGCILVGEDKTVNAVGSSRAAFNELFPKIEAALAKGEVWITVMGGYSSVV